MTYIQLFTRHYTRKSACTAGFPTGCIADFQVGVVWRARGRSSRDRAADQEILDTADREVCGIMDCIRRCSSANPPDGCRGLRSRDCF